MYEKCVPMLTLITDYCQMLVKVRFRPTYGSLAIPGLAWFHRLTIIKLSLRLALC